MDNFNDAALNSPFTKYELLSAIKKLKNNKSTSFDSIGNEMLKTGGKIIADALLLLFNSVLEAGIFPKAWKTSIMQIIHKSGTKTDPNNFRGICVSSSLGKLFNKLLRARLEIYCEKNKLISKSQKGGKAGARTADHLLRNWAGNHS